MNKCLEQIEIWILFNNVENVLSKCLEQNVLSKCLENDLNECLLTDLRPWLLNVIEQILLKNLVPKILLEEVESSLCA